MFSIIIPAVVVFFLVLFIAHIWIKAAKQDRLQRTDLIESQIAAHNERIYKSFEFFIKVFLALVAGLGYIGLEQCAKDPNLIRDAMFGLGFIALVAMLALTISIATHQAAKIRRWEQARLDELWQWQEFWLIFLMTLMGNAFWLVSLLWHPTCR